MCRTLCRASAALAALILSAVFIVTSVAPPAFAEADDTGVTWSVQPADEAGADGRSWVELTLDPGEVATDRLALRNLSATGVTFSIKAADGYLTPTGRFNMLPSDTPSVDAGTWITNPQTVEVGAGETAIVEFTISVPENATPGDHAAGIAATVQSVGPSGDGNSVSIESRVGFPIMTRVTGELKPSLGVDPVRIDYDLSWNPFEPGRVTAVYELVNDGNVRMQAAPILESQGSVAASDPDAAPLELLPGERREVTASVPGVWPIFFIPVSLRIDPMLVTPDGEPQSVDSFTEEFGVWAVPIPQLLVLAGLVLLIFALVAGRRRSRRRVETLVEQAREAGRQEAQR
jgi:hypothetical protein